MLRCCPSEGERCDAAKRASHTVVSGLNPVPISLISDPHSTLVVVVNTNSLAEHFLPPPHKKSTKKQSISLPEWLMDYQDKMKAFFPEEEKKVQQKR
jgi:predicted acylesterase/phospholipase RssA